MTRREGSGPDLPQRRILVLGGARSGKSAYAEAHLGGLSDVVYVATGGRRGADPEWRERVALHRQRRPRSWTTVELEKPLELAELVRGEVRPLLVECLTLWLTAVLDDAGAWSDRDGGVARARVVCDDLLDAWRCRIAPMVVVSNEVGCGIVPSTASGRLFRDELGRLNGLIAREADAVVLTVAGRTLRLR